MTGIAVSLQFQLGATTSRPIYGSCCVHLVGRVWQHASSCVQNFTRKYTLAAVQF